MSETFTMDELVAALLNARRGEDDEHPEAKTVRELVKETGIGQIPLSRRLREMIEADQVEVVRKPFTRIDGIQTVVPAYRLKRGSDADRGGED